MVFFNESGTFGQLISYINVNVTGSLFLTLLFIVIMLIMICALFRIPIEFSAIFILPLLIVITAYVGDFLAVGGVFLIFIGILIAKNLGFK